MSVQTESSHSQYFKDDEHTEVYNKSRPSPPEELIQNIVKYVLEEFPQPLGKALDIGCGSGQSTEVLAPYFKKVLGIDPSEKQIIEAQKKNKCQNVIYRVGSAENIEYPNASAQLITASQACHWFDLPKFYAEVERILMPGGILAMYGYLLPRPLSKDKSEELSDIVFRYYKVTLGKYIPPESRRVYLENYRGQDFMNVPFAKDSVIRDESVSSEILGTIADIVDFMNSGSAFQNYLILEGQEKASALLQEFERELLTCMGVSTSAQETPISIEYKYFLLVAKKPRAQ